jgi:hypothetical protein
MSFNDVEYRITQNGKFITIHSIDDCINSIRIRFETQNETISHLQEENKKLKSEHYKNDKIQELTQQLKKAQSDNYRGFPISAEEFDAIHNWQLKHDEEVHNLKTLEARLQAGGAMGGKYTYEFVPTSIGTIGTVKCSCGAEFTFQNII